MDPMSIAITAVIVVVLFIIVGILPALYQKCGPNEAMIISGGSSKPKVIVGGGTLVIPMLQQKDILSLEVMTIEVRSNAPMITRNGVPIYVQGVAQIKVKGDDISIETASEQFLGKDDDEIRLIAHETLMGHLRAIMGTMTVEQLIDSFDSFAQRVAEVSITDLAKMGLTCVSFTIKEINDDVGYLEALGKKQTAEAKRSAAIGEAEATKETQIAQANATRDAQIAQANAAEEGAKAKLLADTRVAEASKNFQVNQAKYQAEVAEEKAQSDMMYDIRKAKSQQQLVEENQKIKIVEAQKEVELQTVEVQKRQVALEAETIKPAEAEQKRVKLLAQAEQDKRRILAEGDAQALELKARGEANAVRIKAEAEAEAARAMGLAEAEADRARGLAQATIIAARGQAEAEAMAKKAEAFKQYNDAAMASMVIEKLPELVAAAAQPLSKIGNVTLLSTGGETSGMGKLTTDVLNVAAQGMTMVKGLTGIDLVETMKTKGNQQPAPALTQQAQQPTQPRAQAQSSQQQQSQPQPAVTAPRPPQIG
ncbi:MAG: flotillin family protein [Cyanobacteria bacterium HKST-UBA02]|nr:flotillin family protein [Cyanobacteria bacterium HKST-UBA02]